MGLRLPVLTSGCTYTYPSHTVATILYFTLLGSVAAAFIATLGPQTGLRTMIISRYSSGYLGGAFFSVLNIITQFVFFSMLATSPVDTRPLDSAGLR